MKPSQIAWVVATLLLLLSNVRGASASRPYAERVREHTLGNGMKVLMLEDHKAPVGVVQVWYRVGSRNERLGKTGLSHLLEHLMFKGTDKVGPEEHSRIIQRNGGNENAFTTEDNTTYFSTLASDRLHVAIELEADRMRNLKFDEAQFAPELDVVMEERRLRTDNNPASALFEQLKATAYSAHPYQWPVIGWMNDLRLATREDALAYYRQHYSPGNAFVVCVGDFDGDALLAVLEKHFGAVATAPLPPPVYAVEPVQEGERRTVLRRQAHLPFVAIAYHVPNLQSPDAYTLDLLSQILSGGKSARLHQDLVYHRRLARSAAAGYDVTSVDPGLFYLYGQPMPGKKTAELERELLAHVERLKNTHVTERELQKARNGIEAGFVLAQDSLFYQGMLLGEYEIAGDWKKIDEYLPAARAVTAEDIQRIARYYLTEDNRTVATLDALPVPPGQVVPLDASAATVH
jgi:zinc protease